MRCALELVGRIHNGIASRTKFANIEDFPINRRETEGDQGRFADLALGLEGEVFGGVSESTLAFPALGKG